VVFTKGPAIDVLLAGSHKEFPRPATGLNRLLSVISRSLPRRDLTPAKLREWLADSVAVFNEIVDDARPLERISRETAWIISGEEPPDPDVWSGECKFAAGRLPMVICYNQTLASRLPGAAYDVAWQGAMDHFVGHLYPFFGGASDEDEYGEEVACRYQHLAAQSRARRDRRFRLVAFLLPITYRLHKRIPLSNFIALSAGG
jgi:hypothetical protein